MKARKTVTLVAAIALLATGHTAFAEGISYSDGGVHELTAGQTDATDSITLSSASQLNLNGGSLTVSGSQINLTGKSVLRVNEGASLLRGAGTAGTRTVVVSESKLVVDAGVMTVPAGNHSDVKTGTVRIVDGTLEVDNGGSFVMDGERSSFVLAGECRLAVNNGSLFSLTNATEDFYSWVVSYTGARVAVTNSTFVFRRCCLAGNGKGEESCANARLSFHNARVISSANNTYSRSFYVYGGHWKCENNFIGFSGADSVLGTIGFEVSGDAAKNNTIELRDVTVGGPIYLNGGIGNRYLQYNGKHNNEDAKLAGVSNELAVTGGEFFGNNGGGRLTLGGTGCQATFSNCTAYFTAYGANWSMQIPEGTTNGTLTVDESTVTVKGVNDLSKICPGSAIVLRGSAPQIKIDNWGSVAAASYIWKLGSDSGALDGETVALKFVLPAEPYAKAPIYSIADKPLKFCPNAQIVVDAGAWTKGRDKNKTFYPLVYDTTSFGDAMTPELVASLNAHATLPEGMSLEYNSTTKILGLRVPRDVPGALVLIR